MIQICKDFSHHYRTRQMDGTVLLVSVGWRVPRTVYCIFGLIAVSGSVLFSGSFFRLRPFYHFPKAPYRKISSFFFGLVFNYWAT